MISKRRATTSRQKILDTAHRLFYEQGIQNVGVDLISAEADVGKMTLYRHFESKSILVAAYLERRDAQWQTRLSEVISQAGDSATDKVQAWFDTFGRWFASNDFHGCAFINADAERVDKTGAAWVTTHKNAMRSMIETMMRHSGVADSATLAEQIFLLTEGAIVTARLTGSAQPADTACEAALTLLDARAIRYSTS